MRDLLDVRGLTVELPTPAGWARPVNDVSLHIAAGESLGLVGESGSGKTMLALALMGLLPPGARVSGEVWLNKETKEVKENTASGSASGVRKNLVQLNEKEWREVRGREIAMVFQEPMTSLNPVMRIGAQIQEAIRTHGPSLNAGEVHRRTVEALRRAAVPEPEARAEQFPHQLSGGLRQRAMIAMALAGGQNGGSSAGPHLLIADEPTTALDVTVQKQILDLLDHLRKEMWLSLLFITHDLGVVAQVADRVAVMYAGRVVEEGPTRAVLRTPRHPYTQGLLVASPSLERGKLTPIPGSIPQLTALPPAARLNRAAQSAAPNVHRACLTFGWQARTTPRAASWIRESPAPLPGALETDGEHLLIVDNNFFRRVNRHKSIAREFCLQFVARNQRRMYFLEYFHGAGDLASRRDRRGQDRRVFLDDYECSLRGQTADRGNGFAPIHMLEQEHRQYGVKGRSQAGFFDIVDHRHITKAFHRAQPPRKPLKITPIDVRKRRLIRKKDRGREEIKHLSRASTQEQERSFRLRRLRCKIIGDQSGIGLRLPHRRHVIFVIFGLDNGCPGFAQLAFHTAPQFPVLHSHTKSSSKGKGPRNFRRPLRYEVGMKL
jgi:peptide/nickel transport system ATP-binding protein